MGHDGHEFPEKKEKSFDGILDDYVDRFFSGEDLDFDDMSTQHVAIAPELIERLRTYGITRHGSLTDSSQVRVLGDYYLLRQIGSGGMGRVYEAIQKSLKRRVALKTLPGGFSASDTHIQRFQREARATARIEHAHIVPIYEIGCEEDTHYYTMKLVDGPTLAQTIAGMRDQSTTPSTDRTPAGHGRIEHLLAQFRGIAYGLGLAHEQGLVHRDIKPANILIESDGRYVLADFGLVHDDFDETITRSGELLGTPFYMSPEQISRRPSTPRSDVFSLGVTLYEALTLRVPFSKESASELQEAILFDDPIRPRKLNPQINRDLENILLHALEKKPGNRYSNAREFADDLDAFLRYEPVRARPPSVLSRISRKLTKHRLKAASGLMGIILLVAFFSVWTQWPDTRIILRNRRQVTWDAGLTTDPSSFGKGELLAYASDRGNEGHLDIWIQPTTEPSASKQLTSHPADDYQPCFSPDGARVAFSSERKPSGIYIVSRFGGTSQFIAKDGIRPRFSPDGHRIAFWKGERSGDFGGHVFVVSSEGGQSEPLCPGLGSSRWPIWAPAGDFIAFTGTVGDRNWTGRHWYLIRPEGGEPIQLDLDLLQVDISKRVPDLLLWTGDRLVFAFKSNHGVVNLWSAPISTESAGLSGPASIITPGTDEASNAALLSKQQITFSRATKRLDLWKLSLDQHGIGSHLTRLTNDLSSEYKPQNGYSSTLTYLTRASGANRNEIWQYDLESKGKRKLAVFEHPIWSGCLTGPDGRQLAYSKRKTWIRDLESGETREFDYGGPLYEWTDRGLLSAGRNHGISKLDPVSGTRKMLAEAGQFRLFNGTLSPDGQWLAFNAVVQSDSRIFVAPIKEIATREEEWIPITSDAVWVDKPEWSPDGKAVYFISDLDGFRCIYRQVIDRQTGHPRVLEPEPVWHFHNSGLSISSMKLDQFNMTFIEGDLFFNLAELKGNIWIADLDEGY